MINEKFLILMEKYLENEINDSEKEELEKFLKEHPEFKTDLEEQKRIKEVLSKMNLKNPSEEIWDSYWENIYNKYERSFAWLFIFIGGIILIGYGSLEFAEAFLKDTETPPVIKYSTAALVFGFAVLLFSVIREKLFTRKHDKYKEIQR